MTHRSRSAVVATAAILATALAPASRSAVQAEVLPTSTTLESSIDPIAAGAAPGSLASVSGDGRLVAYVAPAADGRARSVYVRDRSNGAVAELTVPGPGVRPGLSTSPAISADGCTVAVVTEMPFDLFHDDDLGDRWDVYRTTLPSCGGSPGDWELVSADPSGALDRVDPAQPPAVSASGKVVAFVVRAEEGSAVPRTVWVTDLAVPLGDLGRTVVAAGLPPGSPSGPYAYVGQTEPEVSADGRLVAFTTDALPGPSGPEWAQGPTPGAAAQSQIVVWDRATAAPTLASAGLPAGTRADQPALSADGLVVAFRTTGPDGISQVATAQLGGAAPTVVSATRADGQVVPGDGASSQPALSSDGSVVGFVTRATNLLPARAAASASPGDGTILLAERASGRLTLVSRRADGASPAAAANARPQLSSSGRVVLYETSAASELVMGAPTVLGRQVVATTLPPRLVAPEVDAGTVTVNVPSPEWIVPITNEGPSAFVPGAIETSDPSFTVVPNGTCVPLVPVAPGATCTVGVMFIPQRPGPVDAVLTVSEIGFAGVTATARLTGEGKDGTLSASPSWVDLGAEAVGETSPSQKVSVQNVGFMPVVMAGAAILGAHPGDFAIVRDGCAGAVLDAMATCEVEVEAGPTAGGSRRALLMVSTSAAQRTSVVLAVEASYRPQLLAAPTVVAGQGLDVMAGGLPPGDPVVLSMPGSRSGSTTLVAGPDGTVSVQFPVSRGERPGQHQLVMADPAGRYAPVSVPAQVRVPGRGLGAASPVRPGG